MLQYCFSIYSSVMVMVISFSSKTKMATTIKILPRNKSSKTLKSPSIWHENQFGVQNKLQMHQHYT